MIDYYDKEYKYKWMLSDYNKLKIKWGIMILYININFDIIDIIYYKQYRYINYSI